MRINDVKTKIKMKPFFACSKYKVFVQHNDGKLKGFIVELKNKERKEFPVKSSKTKVDILGPFQKMEKYIETIK